MSNSILNTMITRLVKDVIKAGFDDPIKEVITFTQDNKKIKFQLYTQEQWDGQFVNNPALELNKKLGFDRKPDEVITIEDKVYLVKLLK